jgi:ABC-type Fe3+-siderophore transport system permease subunit
MPATAPSAAPEEAPRMSVVLQIRGPRIAAAILVGAALAVAGTAFQGLFRNAWPVSRPARTRATSRRETG